MALLAISAGVNMKLLTTITAKNINKAAVKEVNTITMTVIAIFLNKSDICIGFLLMVMALISGGTFSSSLSTATE